MNELLVIEKLELVPFFTKGDLLDDTLEKIKAEAMAHVPDVSTLKGRNAIKANVTKVTKSKTYLEGHGKDLAAEYKLIPRAIDANRKKSKDFLNALVEEIREPLTAWEVIDKAEKQQVIDVAAYLVKFDSDLEEGYRDNELIDLRAKQAEADRQAEIKLAEDAATKKAEDEAAEEIAQKNQELIDSKEREDKAKQKTKDAEWLTYISEAYAHNDKIDSDKQIKAADWLVYIGEAYAHNDKLIAAANAKQAELERQQAEAAQAKTDQNAREANKRHAGGINTKAMNDFISCGLDEASARLAVKALASGRIRNAGINY